MSQEIVIFLHGYGTRGGLNGSKARFLHEQFRTYPSIVFYAIDFTPTPKDFQYHTITGMIDRLRQYSLDRDLDTFTLIAISQGANVALNYAHHYENVKRLLLLSPELYYDSYSTEEELQAWAERVDGLPFHYGFQKHLPLNYGHHQDGLRYVTPPPPPAPTTLFHGVNDTAIPLARSRQYAAQYPDLVHLIEVESDHFLNDQHERIWAVTKEILGL